jgi:hypothetical protein
MRESAIRVQRFIAIWRISGSLGLALEALRWRCQQVVLNFLVAGGRLNDGTVEYLNTRLPRPPFGAGRLAGVGYLQQLGDHGASFAQLDDGSYLTTMPDGLRFAVAEEMFTEAMCVLVERFVEQEYAWLDVAGRIVIDIGANVGDSVLYFARRQAIHVYGYEPEPNVFDAAVNNLALNQVANASVVRASVAAGDGDGQDGAPEVSLKSVLETARAEHPGLEIVCKIVCEGCEYEILAPENVDRSLLERVSQVMIEYHWRPPTPLQDTLEAHGFEVESTLGAQGVGWIRARRPL